MYLIYPNLLTVEPVRLIW